MENKKVNILVEVHFNNFARPTELFDGVKQILMTNESTISLTHGTRVISMPYEEIEKIKIKFNIVPEG